MELLKEMTTEELELALAERKKNEKKEALAKKTAYETKKEELVRSLVSEAEGISEILSIFKKIAREELDAFYAMMHEYGDLPKTNKGNFSIKSADGLLKVDYKRQVNFSFDERATLADQKLKGFLSSFVKKKDNDAYELITTLLEKDKAGNYDPRLIHRLYKFEDKFEHPEWKDALRLFKEAYQESSTAIYVHFTKHDEQGKAHHINLNFSSI